MVCEKLIYINRKSDCMSDCHNHIYLFFSLLKVWYWINIVSKWGATNCVCAVNLLLSYKRYFPHISNFSFFFFRYVGYYKSLFCMPGKSDFFHMPFNILLNFWVALEVLCGGTDVINLTLYSTRNCIQYFAGYRNKFIHIK